MCSCLVPVKKMPGRYKYLQSRDREGNELPLQSDENLQQAPGVRHVRELLLPCNTAVVSHLRGKGQHYTISSTQGGCTRGDIRRVPVLNGYPLTSGKKHPGTREYLRLFWAGRRVPVRHPGTRLTSGYPTPGYPGTQDIIYHHVWSLKFARN